MPASPPSADASHPQPAERPPAGGLWGRIRAQIGAGPAVVALTFVVLATGLLAVERTLLDDLLDSQLELLTGYMRTATDRMQGELRAAEIRVDRLRRVLESTTPGPAPADRAAFDRMLSRRPDGSWRPRVETFVPSREAGVWLPAGAPDLATMNLVVHGKRTLDTLGFATLSNAFDDVWIIPRTGGEVILYPSDPAYVWQQDPTTDYTATSWLTLAGPDGNPEREVRWTEDLLAQSNSEWYTSVLAPLWLHDGFAGSVGQDLTIGKLVDEVGRNIQDVGGWLVVLGARRQVLFSTAHRAEMARAAGQFSIDSLSLAGLPEALGTLTTDPRPGAIARRDGAQEYLLASRIAPLGWTLVAVLPRSTIAAAIVRSVKGTRLFIGGGITAMLLVSLLVINREMRRRRRSEEATRQSELWFARLFQLLPDGVAIVRPETGTIVEVNDALCRITGHDRDACIGRTTLDLGLWSEPAKRSEVLRVLDAEGEARAVPVEVRRRDGSLIHTLYSGRVIDYAGDRMVLSVLTDVSAQRSLEERLIQAEKMEAIGRLAGGVAHDFNNLITAIAGYAELLRDGLPEGDARRDDAAEILRSAERGAGLTKQLLGFARRQIVQPRVVDLERLLHDLGKLLQRLLGADIALVIDAAPGTPPVLADVGQLEQVVTNLAVNARDAMPDGGRLVFRLRAVGGEVVLTVTDTGAGIEPDVLPMLFEPFFTTKERGKGTGLGLATCYGIVRQAGGRIEVSSRLGEGTTFRVILPAAATEAAEADPSGPASAEPAPTGPATILVVEDEPQVREYLARTLETLGHRVTAVENGVAGLAVAATRDQPFDLVISDVVMPGMGGVAMVERLRERWPTVDALFLSGYTDDRVLRQEIAADPVRFLAKPFTRDELARRVRELLGRKAA